MIRAVRDPAQAERAALQAAASGGGGPGVPVSAGLAVFALAARELPPEAGRAEITAWAEEAGLDPRLLLQALHS